MNVAGRLSKVPGVFNRGNSRMTLADAELVRGDIPVEFQPLLQGNQPKIVIPESSGLYQAGTIFCMQGEVIFAEGVPSSPVYLLVDRSRSDNNVRISRRRPHKTLAANFDDMDTLDSWNETMREAYASGVPHFDEIKQRLHSAIGDVVPIKLGYGIKLGYQGDRLLLVARGLCRDVYYEAAVVDGVLCYRTQYCGPTPSETFDLTADQLWEELMRATLADIPYLFKAPKDFQTSVDDYEEDDED